jgi:hypothetical protein
LNTKGQRLLWRRQTGDNNDKYSSGGTAENDETPHENLPHRILSRPNDSAGQPSLFLAAGRNGVGRVWIIESQKGNF